MYIKQHGRKNAEQTTHSDKKQHALTKTHAEKQKKNTKKNIKKRALDLHFEKPHALDAHKYNKTCDENTRA